MWGIAVGMIITTTTKVTGTESPPWVQGLRIAGEAAVSGKSGIHNVGCPVFKTLFQCSMLLL